jgi:uncharacterized protein YdaU (DUF1376 family)
MPLYASDYLGDTGHLSTEEHGAYLLILMQMWNAGGSLPSDPAKLARVARCSTKKWLAMADTILAFFHIDGDRITNDRLTKERQKVEAKTEVRRAAGAMGGTAKAQKTKKQRVANAVAKPCHSPEPDTNSDTNVSEHPSMELQKAFDAYQATAERLKAEHGKTVWPAVVKFTDKRRARLKARIRENGLEAWGVVLRKARDSQFCTGSTGWVADFDFLTSPEGFLKTLEGKYDDRPIDQKRFGAARAADPNAVNAPRGAFDRVVGRLDESPPVGLDAGRSNLSAFDAAAIDGEFTVIPSGAGSGTDWSGRGSDQTDAGSLFAKRRA